MQQVGYSWWARALSKSNDNPILFFVFSEIENAVEKSSSKVFLLNSVTLICMHRTSKKCALLIVDQNYFQVLQGQVVQQCFSFLPSATIQFLAERDTDISRNSAAKGLRHIYIVFPSSYWQFRNLNETSRRLLLVKNRKQPKYND